MKIEWKPGIGDPTVWGWFTVAAYIAAAVFAIKASKAAQISGREWKIESAFWLGVTIAMVALGINKQLDLQSLLTELARDWSKASGWYEGRRAVQEIAISLMAASALAIAIHLSVSLRRTAIEVRLAVLGLCFVLAFVVIRAASFHHIDALLNSRFIGINWNALLELPGVIVTAILAARYAMRIKYRARGHAAHCRDNDRY